MQIPQGFSPEPAFGGSACIINNMRALPVYFGGLVLDPEGLAEPHVKGGCADARCTKGSVFVFDTPAHGWETIEVSSDPYPDGRAGHTLTGEKRLTSFLLRSCTLYEQLVPDSCSHGPFNRLQAHTLLHWFVAASPQYLKGPERMFRSAMDRVATCRRKSYYTPRAPFPARASALLIQDSPAPAF